MSGLAVQAGSCRGRGSERDGIINNKKKKRTSLGGGVTRTGAYVYLNSVHVRPSRIHTTMKRKQGAEKNEVQMIEGKERPGCRPGACVLSRTENAICLKKKKKSAERLPIEIARIEGNKTSNSLMAELSRLDGEAGCSVWDQRGASRRSVEGPQHS